MSPFHKTICDISAKELQLNSYFVSLNSLIFPRLAQKGSEKGLSAASACREIYQKQRTFWSLFSEASPHPRRGLVCTNTSFLSFPKSSLNITITFEQLDGAFFSPPA